MSKKKNPLTIRMRLAKIETDIAGMKKDISWLRNLVILVLTGIIGILWAILGGI